MNLEKKDIMKLLVFIAFLIVCIVNLGLIAQGIGGIFALLTPFIVGAGIAFIINVPMNFIEEKLLRFKGRARKLKRPLALVLTFIFLILLILFVIFLVVPEVVNTIGVIAEGVPKAFNQFINWIDQFTKENTEIVDYFTQMSIDWQGYLAKLSESLKNGLQGMLNSTAVFVSGTFSTVLNFVIGLVFAIYILLQKERLCRQGKQVLYAFLPTKHVEYTLKVLTLSEQTFHNFLTGQCLEAVILGTMFFIVMSIFRMPYVLLISVLIAATALIPVFGAFIGCVVGTFLILFVSPIQAGWFIVLFLVLQQVEGNLIYPHVVGNSVGLPAMWVLVAVTLGASLMGVVGMLIFIPICSVLYALFREHVKKRIAEKKIPASKFKVN